MNARLRHISVLVLGWGFLLLGVAGLFLPILQGILFILAGLMILSTQYAWAHRLLEHLRRRFPKISRTADEAAAKASAWLHRVAGQKQAD
ncbi:MAG TPA: PGPGW domain-containing protein [Terriglobales bacterium]|nr:PGPGW domain-containing protein [Terriglobales bacterium]